MLTAPAPAASAPPAEVRPGTASGLPQTHQMLDSAPPAPPAAPVTPFAPGSAADAQLNARVNAQMRVGVRSDAFGAVEIHSVVQQSQVGITVHSDRDVSRWFGSEVASLESGLKQHHLNLTAVDFERGRSGVETATSFQHGGQPRQPFSTPAGAEFAASASGAAQEEDTVTEAASASISPPGPFAARETRVSIHV